jgi:hypothetical protein
MNTENKEIRFFSEQGVQVTNARLIVPGKTYAMANITSVSTKRENPSYSGVKFTGGLAFLMGFAALPFGSWQLGILAIMLIAVAVVWGLSLKPDFHLKISSASGESSALSSKDQLYVERIVQAIQDAIIHRG